MGSKGSSTTSFTPPPEVVEAYKEALGYGRAAMGQQYQPYTGEITAPLTPTQESGITNVNRAVGTAIPYFGQATAMTANAANTPITPQQFSQEAIQQYQSPYTQAVADATFRNLREQQRQEQAGLQGQAIRAGAFGGDRAGIAAANMARQQDLATAQAMSQIYNQGYGQAVGLFGQQQGVNYGADVANAARQMQGAQQLAGLGTGLQGSVLQGAQAQLAAGAQQQAVQQAINSGYYNQYLGAQAYPYQQAQFFANLATGVGGQMGGTTTGQQAQPSPVGSIFGALGALGSIFSASDKRVKENIKPIGKTNDGQTIYRYNFKGDPTTQIGLIAQEVEKKHPEAVRTFNGVKGVDYKEATDDSVRSMGGGVVPSSTRKDFAAGGPSLSDEEDPMIPYKAGVPSKVLQIPKLAKIGGGKPNFGGNLPQQAQGPSAKEWVGAGEGLGKAWNKLTASDTKMSGFENLGKDFEDMLPSSAFSKAFAARGGAIGGLRPRFADGEDVPVTPETVVVSEDKPVRVASLGEVERRVDAGIPSSEPAREPARDVEPKVGLVPSMARASADLPPLFGGKEAPEPSRMSAAAAQAAAAEPEKSGLSPVKAPAPKGALLAVGTNDWANEDAAYAGIMKSAEALKNAGRDVVLVAPAKIVNDQPHAYNAAQRAAADLGVKLVEPASFGKGIDHYHITSDAARQLKEQFPGYEVYGDSNAVRLGAKEGVTGKVGASGSEVSRIIAQSGKQDQAAPAKPGVVPENVPYAKQKVPLTPEERDAAIRTLYGEAGREPVAGQIGVAQVIKKRQLLGNYGGNTVQSVVYAPKQFSMYNPGDPAGEAARKLSADSPQYKQLGQIVDSVWSGEAEDPTSGATHFLNKDTVMKMYGKLPSWAVNMPGETKIPGSLHTFGQADAGAYSPSKGGTPSAGGKTLGDIQASYKGPTGEKAEGGKPVKVASAGESWPGFGVAGEGKRSVIESIMGKDLDPLQKRAMFAFFAGMAASPSPWFGQQLGAGMQAASNVYNDSMNKQAEIGIKKEQLGLEEQKIGVSERLAEVQEKTKAIEALKFWQSRFKQIPTAEGFAYLDTTTGQTISQDEYNRQMGQVTRQLKLAPTDTGGVSPKPGLAPSAPAGAAPTGGLAPQPKPEVKATPEVDGGAGAETAPVTIPKPTEVPKTTAETKPAEAPAKAAVEAAKPKADAEAAIYQNVRDDYNPIVLREKSDEQRKIATNAQKLGDLAAAKAANDLADSYSKKAIEITDNKIPVVFKDGTVGRIPEIEKEALRTEGVKESQKINVADNTKWFNDQANDQIKRNMLIARNNQLIKINEEFESGRFAEQKANLVASLRAVGINVPSSATANPEAFQEFVKNRINNVFDEVKAIGGQVRVAEITGLEAGQSGPEMESIANRAILGYNKGVLEWENKKFKDAVEEAKKKGIGQFNRSEWVVDWSEKNNLDDYIEKGKKSVATLGATPSDWKQLKEGQTYILKEGQYGAKKRGKYVYRGVKEQDGQPGLDFQPVRGQ